MSWHIITTPEFDDWFVELPEELQIAVAARRVLLENLGPHLGRPHADTLNGSKHANMKELRIDENQHVIRTAFAFDPQRTGILLIAGEKQGKSSDRFYKQLIKQADRLYDRHLNDLDD